MSVQRVTVKCPTCPWQGQRSPKRWDQTPCPRCSCAVELVPGAHVDPEEPRERFEPENPPPARSFFDGMRRPRQEIAERVQVNLETMTLLQRDRRVPPHQAAQKVLEEWAAEQQ